MEMIDLKNDKNTGLDNSEELPEWDLDEEEEDDESKTNDNNNSPNSVPIILMNKSIDNTTDSSGMKLPTSSRSLSKQYSEPTRKSNEHSEDLINQARHKSTQSEGGVNLPVEGLKVPVVTIIGTKKKEKRITKKIFF